MRPTGTQGLLSGLLILLSCTYATAFVFLRQKNVKHKAPPPVPRKPTAAGGRSEPQRACNVCSAEHRRTVIMTVVHWGFWWLGLVCCCVFRQDGSAEDEDLAGPGVVYDEDPDEVDTCKEVSVTFSFTVTFFCLCTTLKSCLFFFLSRRSH